MKYGGSVLVFFFFLYTILFIEEVVTETESSGYKLEGVNASILGKHLDFLMNATLGVNEMQKRINLLNFTRRRYQGSVLVKQFAEKIAEKISLPIEGVKRTRNILEEEINKGQHEVSSRATWTSCCRYDDKKILFNKDFKTKIDENQICQLVSESTPLAYYSLPESVLTTMRQNRKDIPFMKWQYVGSNQGVLFTYPAHHRPELCVGTHYDPRYRPWYVEAASPEKKHVIIVIDSSNSMAQTHNSKRLIDIAVDAIGTVMETLTPADKIGVMAFNDSAYFPDNCFSKQLGIADRINKRKLKEGFLNLLQPGGQSNYAKAFRAAFGLLQSSWSEARKHLEYRAKLRIPFKCVMLFISDGDASEIHRNKINEIYKEIREGNRAIMNLITMFTYGIGRSVNSTLLEKIAGQDFDEELGPAPDSPVYKGRFPPNVTAGKFYRIAEPSELRNQLSFFYTNLIKNESYIETEPSFSVPYVDQGGLGLIFTVGFPVVGRRDGRTFLAAVAAVDISISDLLGEVIKLKNDDRSYVFVIDGTGRVLVHPLMPLPGDVSDVPSFIRIEAFERESALKPVIESMMHGKIGNLTLLSTRVAPAGDCNKVFVVYQTYHWHPIPNTNFSLCFVEEITDYTVSLLPEFAIHACHDDQGNPLAISQCRNMSSVDFQYHRLDLSGASDVCRHFYQMSTVKSSVVKFAPQCFRDPVWYEQTSETRDQVEIYNKFFDQMLAVTSSQEARLVQDQYDVDDILYGDVISDVIWTSCADSLWLQKAEHHVIRRYIGTRTGMVRFYPGTNVSAAFDPIQRDWYELALAHPSIRVFSPPYKDAAGAGNVITISHTMHTPQIEENAENEGVTEAKVIGVMGLDLSLTSFYAKLVELYPNCREKWHCILVDDRGYMVLHQDYTKTDAPERKHITGDEGQLARILLDTGLMFRARCLEFESTTYKVSYVIVDGAYLNRMSEKFEKCTRYYMELIPNSNIYFIAREYHSSCYYYECTIKNELCYQHHKCVSHDNWSNKTCECPCRADLVIESCSSSVQAQRDIVSCYPFRHGGSVIKTDCIPASLPLCNDPQCSKETEHYNCSSMVGCTWCQKSQTGSTLERPYCADTDQCYNGYEGQRLPGFTAEQKTCNSQKDMENKVIIFVCVSIAVLIIVIISVVIGCWQLHRKMNAKKKNLWTNGKASQQLKTKQNDAVSTIAAAIGASERALKSNGNHSSTGQSSRPLSGTTRHNSISSKTSSSRKRSLSTPQVILSIIDSDGAEIARSLPRPVQIVRGNQGKSTPTPDGSKTPIPISERQIRSSSTTSIVLGSAEESSGFSSSGNSRGEILNRTQPNKQSRKNGNASNNCSAEGSAEAVIRKRILSAPGRHNSAVSNRGRSRAKRHREYTSSVDDVKFRRKGSSSEEREQATSRSSRALSLAIGFLSGLRKKPHATEPEMDEEENKYSESDESIEPEIRIEDYYDMFADPSNNEGDIPIIQSDHSDPEMEEIRRISPTTSDYVSVCSESGRMSVCSWLTTPRERKGLWNSVVNISDNDDEMQHDAINSHDVFYDEGSFTVPSLSVDFTIGEDFKLSPAHSRQQQSNEVTSQTDDVIPNDDVIPSDDVTSDKMTDHESTNKPITSAEGNNIKNESFEPKHESRDGSQSAMSSKSKTRKKQGKKQKTGAADRLKNLNTENFIVYV